MDGYMDGQAETKTNKYTKGYEPNHVANARKTLGPRGTHNDPCTSPCWSLQSRSCSSKPPFLSALALASETMANHGSKSMYWSPGRAELCDLLSFLSAVSENVGKLLMFFPVLELKPCRFLLDWLAKQQLMKPCPHLSLTAFRPYTHACLSVTRQPCFVNIEPGRLAPSTMLIPACVPAPMQLPCVPSLPQRPKAMTRAAGDCGIG